MTKACRSDHLFNGAALLVLAFVKPIDRYRGCKRSLCSGRKGRSPGGIDGALQQHVCTLVEKLVDLVTHGRALKPVLRYYYKESKVKDKGK